MNMLIVGGGKVGEYLAHLLTDAGHQVAVIERRPDLQRRLHDIGMIAHVGDDQLARTHAVTSWACMGGWGTGTATCSGWA
ncbi:MAG TPA: NAD-binding protein, partial [Roseiflexaceae bacterium]|nr:NAD-binding protein [Roseiflexaceae bacterium]